ncbi:MAG: hypothetical protein HFG80_02945 [Eubacterium sp.]|nr:hypothetical protein [Eubacterium sp.]
MIFDLIILVYGVYSIVNTVKMKKTGEPGKWLTGELPVKKMKDVDGFINYMYVKTMILGVLSIAYGLAGIIDERLQVLGPIKYILLLAFLAVFIIFCVALHKAKKKYL